MTTSIPKYIEDGKLGWGLEIDISRLELQLMLLPRPMGEVVGCMGMKKYVQSGANPAPPLPGVG